jgi:16S rRNA (adenine1518-N6/adenine1519-N6)-dimethyltransferase
MRADQVKAVLESIGKRPTKRLGQNFLLDDAVISRQVGFAELSSEDTVLEIGPGLGNLTEEILRSGAKVVAVEQDPEFCRFLSKRFGDRIKLVQADAVKAFLPRFDKVVSNLPYQISSPITFKLLGIGFEVAVLMLQREFADRMVARPGTRDYGRLSVGVYYRADCEIMFNVSRDSFWPQPKVDSCVVRLHPKAPPFKVKDENMFYRVTQAIFSHRRKMVSNSLKTDPAVSAWRSGDVAARLDSLPYASKRAEELSPEMIGELADALLDLSASSTRTS